MVLMTQILEGQGGRQTMRVGEGCFTSAWCQLLLHRLGVSCRLEVCLFQFGVVISKNSSPPASLSLEILAVTLALGGVFLLRSFVVARLNWILGLRHWLYFRYQK
jgi:hypothetical protein